MPQFADRRRDPRGDDIQIRYGSGAQTAVHNDRLVLRVPEARAGRASQPDGAVSAAPVGAVPAAGWTGLTVSSLALPYGRMHNRQGSASGSI